VILGVEFNKAEFVPWSKTTPFPPKPIPDGLIDAWSSVLNKQRVVDVQFNVNGTIIYASSAVLAKRSEYFQRMFQENWAENEKKGAKERQSPSSQPHTTNTLTGASSRLLTSHGGQQSLSNITYNIDVTDFLPETFLELLRFL
jgi:hypothetical protein